MITWGISSDSHNAALSVFVGDNLIFASESERFSKIKNDPYICESLVEYALQYGDPNLICWYENPFNKKIRQITAGQGPFIKNFTKYFNCEHKFFDHHYVHACGGYYTSNFSNAAILVIDAIGEFQTMTIWEANGDILSLKYELKYPNSIGLWYSAMTKRCGLKPNEEEYILMALSAFGDKNKLTQDILNELIGEDFKCKKNFHRGCGDWKSEESIEDISAATQNVYELLLNNALKLTKKLVNSNNLVFMGGCALNCVANIKTYNYFKNVWIMPAPGDSGSAIGAVLAHKQKRIKFTPYLGHYINQLDHNSDIVNYLLKNKICGVARGYAEFGPRALGARSLFADPRDLNIKDKVNEIKKRQNFRPFSPVIPIEYAKKYFDMCDDLVDSPYMQYAVKCKYPERFPGIVHVDGTSRIQTVRKSDAPRLYDLLCRWNAKTGCPMLLNTSLNIKGQPILNDRNDCILWSNTHHVKIFS
jgi:carbamoyltransferase